MSESSTPCGDLAERTLPHLHEAVLPVLARWARAPTRVLDLGAGTGAWAARLRRAGYEVVAVERDARSFALPGVECLPLDLNGRFSDGLCGRKFPAITSIEVIEHLENPRAFLRECRDLLEDDGVLVMTTPNIENVPARLRFLARGDLRMFGRDPALNDPTHITPVHTLMLERMLADTGLALVEHTFDRPSPRVARPIFRVLSAVLTPFLRGPKGGDCHVLVVRKETAHPPEHPVEAPRCRRPPLR